MDLPNLAWRRPISSPSEIDSSVKRMEICNKIFTTIGKVISNIDTLSSESDIDTDLEFMKILNRMITSVNSLGKMFWNLRNEILRLVKYLGIILSQTTFMPFLSRYLCSIFYTSMQRCSWNTGPPNRWLRLFIYWQFRLCERMLCVQCWKMWRKCILSHIRKNNKKNININHIKRII